VNTTTTLIELIKQLDNKKVKYNIIDEGDGYKRVENSDFWIDFDKKNIIQYSSVFY
jgi:hypothetical protein